MNISEALPGGGGASKPAALQVAVVRDGDRLGVWGNGIGGWLLENVWCIPKQQIVTYCTDKPSGSGFKVGDVQLGQDGMGRGVRVRSLRMYNYAIPRCVQNRTVVLQALGCQYPCGMPGFTLVMLDFNKGPAMVLLLAASIHTQLWTHMRHAGVHMCWRVQTFTPNGS